MNGRRIVVTVLGAVSALIAGLVGAVSLTRIAGDYLGFPSDLEWTLTGAVDVAAVAGGIMWTGFRGRVRRVGIPMNVVCTLVSGIGVGLDHATNAGRILADGRSGNVTVDVGWWPVAAFLVGMFVPLLFTWLVHALAIIGDQEAPAGADQVPVGNHAEVTNVPPATTAATDVASVEQPSGPAPGPVLTPEAGVPAAVVDEQGQEPVNDAGGEPPTAVGARAVARAWLIDNYVDGMQPAALTAAMDEQGVDVSRQESSRNIKWAAAQPWASRTHLQPHPSDREEVPA